MKFRRTRQIKCVSENNARDFEREVNLILGKYEVQSMKYETNVPFTVYIEIMDEVYIPETLAEEYEVRGCAGHCCECPYFAENPDRRTKWHYCFKHDKKVTKDHFACDDYYLEKGGNDVPSIRGKDERNEHHSRGFEDIAQKRSNLGNISQIKWQDTIFSSGERDFVPAFQDKCR